MKEIDVISPSKSNYDAIDLLKFICCLLIIVIHSQFYLPWMKPYVRIAVPIFFVVSSFFFFKKNPDISNLKVYIKRLLFLYLFWFIFWLPFYSYSHRDDLFQISPLNGVVFFFQSFFFGSTFEASWYIMASIIGTLIVFLWGRIFNNLVLLLLGCLIYIIAVLGTTYHDLFCTFGLLNDWFREYTGTNMTVSFPVSIIYICIGKYLSDIFYQQNFGSKRNMLLIIIFFSILGLQLEYQFVEPYFLCDDSFFFLIPVSVCIVLLALSLQVSIPKAKVLRKISTIVYCSHYSLIFLCSMVSFVFLDITELTPFSKFLVALFGSLFLCFIILALESKKYFKWLKFSY